MLDPRTRKTPCATKPMHHDYCAHKPQRLKLASPKARAPATPEATATKGPCTAAREEAPLTAARKNLFTAMKTSAAFPLPPRKMLWAM